MTFCWAKQWRYQLPVENTVYLNMCGTQLLLFCIINKRYPTKVIPLNCNMWNIEAEMQQVLLTCYQMGIFFDSFYLYQHVYGKCFKVQSK